MCPRKNKQNPEDPYTGRSNHIVTKIFKVHGNGITGSHNSTETVNGSLQKDIGKTENSPLQSRRNMDQPIYRQIGIAMRSENVSAAMQKFLHYVTVPEVK